jgi:hypothetical protein
MRHLITASESRAVEDVTLDRHTWQTANRGRQLDTRDETSERGMEAQDVEILRFL